VEDYKLYTYVPQSGEVGISQMEGSAAATEQITAFSDQEAGWTTCIKGGSDATMNLSSNSDSDLGNFLERPIRIHEAPWIMGQPLFTTFNPWVDFMSNPRVKEKIAHYELLRMNLHVKFVISGTGFHYGRALASYNPYLFDEITIQRNYLDVDLVQASQKPHIFLNPTTNSGGQLDLPYFYHKNYMSLSEFDSTRMGDITLKSFDVLRHANGGDDPVTVTAYAWASDVVLTMPTSLTSLTYEPQAGKMNSGDEYGKGIISAPASAIAHAAGQLTNVPIIAPYARATEMVAKGVGELATHWGYSRPPIITDIVLQKPNPTGNMANTDAADAVQKLSLDSKQELTIDSRTTGLDGTDQMDIVNIANRESYLTQFTMTTSDTPDKLLWNSRVSPCLYRTREDEIHPTPMSMISTPFTNWQGTVKFRFQIVKSSFHKGRLLFRWDPRSHGANIEYNTVYSRVIDLAEDEDFEIEIGWGQASPFLQVEQMRGDTSDLFGVTRLPTSYAEKFNGILEVNVLNSLVSPATDTPISINVFVSCCDDIKFGGISTTAMKALSIFKTPPAAQLATIYEPQSGIVDGAAIAGTSEGAVDSPVAPDPIQAIAPTGVVADQTMNVFFGEQPKSLRDLFRRYVLHRTKVTPPPGSGIMKVITIRENGLGYWPGWDPNGIDTIAAVPCSISIPHFFHFFMPCYAGWRGATRTKYTFEGNLSKNPTVTRIGYTTAPYELGALLNKADSNALSQSLTYLTSQFTTGGAASTNLGVNDTIEVETPYYNGVRFSAARLPSADAGNLSESNAISITVNGSTAQAGDVFDKHAYLRSWKSVGEDFTLFFFTGCPILYRNEIVVPMPP
jgi:hypothetical protein